MKMQYLLGAMLSVAFFAAAQPVAANASDQITEAFVEISTQTSWPVAGTTTNDISSAFGPRIRAATGAYDFHTGVDIAAAEGTSVLAAEDGEVWRVVDFENGGTTVVLRHKFASAVQYGDSSLNYYYTYYMHLSGVDPSVVEAATAGERMPVSQGQVIGQVGHTGNAHSDHLHFELRVGTWCSLEYQLANPDSSCSKGFGFDPARNAMLLFEPNGDTASLTQQEDKGTFLYASDDASPLLNRVEVSVYDVHRGRVVASHALDFNSREGFDPTSDATLDTQNTQQPYIAPQSFGTSATAFHSRIVVPKTWLGKKIGTRYLLTVSAIDIWGNRVSAIWQRGK